MNTYSLIEKLAIVKSLDEIIIANCEIAAGEIKMLDEIMRQLEFNTEFVEEARKMRLSDSLDVLKRMPLVRKKLFANLMYKIAIADGYIDEMETNLIIDIYKEADIDIENPDNSTVDLDLSYLHIDSNGYYEYPDGKEGSRKFRESIKLIKMEPIVDSSDEYSFMIYDSGENRSLWGRDITSKPLKVKLFSNADGLVRFHSDEFGKTEVAIYHDGPDIEKLSLEMAKPFRFVEYVV